MTLTPSIDEQFQIAATVQRRDASLSRRERKAEAVVGGAFLLACLAMTLAFPPDLDQLRVTAALASALTLVVAARARFAVGAGYTVPTQLAFIPLAFAVPPALLPPSVAVLLVLAQTPECARGSLAVGRLWLAPANAWFAVGPALVLAVHGDASAADAALVLVVGMFAAQVCVDGVVGAVRDRLHGDFSLAQIRSESWLYVVDAGLTPIAFIAAVQLVARPWAPLAMIPLIAILVLFARERDAHLSSLTELNDAYRGTALVLGDVVEADDGYTGEHCRDVVDLALEVGGRMRLSAAQMRNLEFGALLHDVGKVAIPKSIINKPGPLDDGEWAVLKTHTVEGQRMLDRVGGFMSEVGWIVRSHHERWDGTGYPDGLAAGEIPLEARIIACCDAWNAMTTDRSYRPAMPPEAARAELRIHAGTQFDPRVVAHLLAATAPSEPGQPSSPAMANRPVPGTGGEVGTTHEPSVAR